MKKWIAGLLAMILMVMSFSACAPAAYQGPIQGPLPARVVVATYQGCDLTLTINELTYKASVTVGGVNCLLPNTQLTQVQVVTKLDSVVLGRGDSLLDGFGLLGVPRKPGEALIFQINVFGAWVKVYELPWE